MASQKPADLDQQCFIKGKSSFSRTRVKRNAFSLMGIKILPFKKQHLESIKIARKDFLEACLPIRT